MAEELCWIVGPDRAAVRRRESRVYSLGSKPDKLSRVPMGLHLSLARTDVDLAAEPAATRALVRVGLPALRLSQNVAWVLVLLCAAASAVGFSLGQSGPLAAPAQHITGWGELLGALSGAALGLALAAFWEAGLVAAQLAERRGFFGLGRLGPTVEPVVWQLGIPGSYAWLSLLGPAVGATACLAWSKSWPALGSGLAIGALFALLRVSLPLRPGPGTRILETLLGAQDLSRGLRWALAARFLPAGQRIATGGAGAMAVGGVGLALWIATIGALGYQYQDAALHHLRVLYDIYPVAQTYIEMSSYRSGLVAQVKSGGSLPPDLRSWLNDSYTTATKDEPGSDYFGTPYRASYDDRGHAQLRSCGRDRRCHSSDDLIMPL